MRYLHRFIVELVDTDTYLTQDLTWEPLEQAKLFVDRPAASGRWTVHECWLALDIIDDTEAPDAG
jgi:hypothetical protein